MVLSKIIEIGIYPGMDEFLKRKIITSNFFAAVSVFLGTGFIVITGLIYDSVYINLCPPIYVIICMISFALNAQRVYTLSRLMLSAGLTIPYTFYHILIMQNDDSPIASLYLLQLIFFTVPWIIFDIREKLPFFVSVIFNSSLFFLIPMLNLTIGAGVIVDSGYFVNGFLYHFSVLTFLMLVGGILLFFNMNSVASENKNTEYLNSINQQHLELKEKESQMQEYITDLEKAKEEDKKRQWTSDGINLITDLLRAQYISHAKLYDKIVNEIVKYVGANQGALFLSKKYDDKIQLELQSCYAYNRKKYLEKYFNPGDGIIGQAFLERNVVFITDVPSEYVTISSGLGESRPRNIVIVPILNSDMEAIGVLEFALFKILERYQVEFLEVIANRLAAHIVSLQRTSSLEELLSTVQKKNEEMKSQEEELRQNMEEVQAMQETFERREKEYQQEIEILKRQLTV